MKKLICFSLFIIASIATAQTNRFPPINLYTGDPTGHPCSITNSLVQSTTTAAIYGCTSAGVYAPLPPDSSKLPLSGGTLTGPIAFSSNSATNTTMTNLGITQTGTPGTSSQVDTFPGTVAAGTVNGVVNACSYPGATADQQITAALETISSGGTVDARCYGYSTQTIASTLVWGTSVSQKIIFSPSTIFQPASATTQILNPGPNASAEHLHIDTTNQSSYSVPAILVNTNVGRSGSTPLSLYDVVVVGNSNTAVAGSACIKISASNVTTQSVYDADIRQFHCTGEYYGYELVASGTGFINGNNFSGWTDTYSNVGLSLSTTGSNAGAQIAGNNLSNYVYEAGPSPTYGMSMTASPGTSGVVSNTFTNIALWDVSSPGFAIINTSSSNAGNVFLGYIGGPISDVDPGGAGGSNIYINGPSISINNLTASGVITALALGAQNINNSTNTTVSIPYTSTGNTGFPGNVVGSGSPTISSPNLTGTPTLGWWQQEPGTITDPGFTGYTGVTFPQYGESIQSFNGIGPAETISSYGGVFMYTLGLRRMSLFYNGDVSIGMSTDPGAPFGVNGTIKAGSGAGNYVPLQSTGTQTAGALACIKSVGPPVVIGTCTAVSGATCTTCN